MAYITSKSKRVTVTPTRTLRITKSQKIPKTERVNLFLRHTNDNNIKIEVNEESSFDAIKDKDRYIFAFNFTNGLTQDRLFHVKTDKYPLDYIEDTWFQGTLL